MSYANYLRSLIDPDVFYKGKPIFRSDFHFKYLHDNKWIVTFINHAEHFECILSIQEIDKYGVDFNPTKRQLRKFYSFLKSHKNVKRFER